MTLTLPIDGKQVKLRLKYLPLNSLLADEENPRIGLFKDHQPKDQLSQDEIIFALKNKSPEAYSKLKDSIQNNKGIINPIWVEPDQSSFRVIEGNSRLTVYQDLRKLEPNESQWQNIICYVLPNQVNSEEKNYIRLQAHLRGTNEWDAYEKAKYLYKLSVEDVWPLSKIEKQTKLTKREIEQNIEAFKTMRNQYLPTHPDPFEVSKFSYFVEYIKDKKLQKAMDKNGFGVSHFCQWVADRKMLPTGQDVRRLRDILEDQDATDAFINGGFEASIGILAYRNPNITNPFYRDVEKVIDRLKNIPMYEIEDISDEEGGGKKRLIGDLAKWSNKILDMINKD
jgi:hypothetical protein